MKNVYHATVPLLFLTVPSQIGTVECPIFKGIKGYIAKIKGYCSTVPVKTRIRCAKITNKVSRLTKLVYWNITLVMLILRALINTGTVEQYMRIIDNYLLIFGKIGHSTVPICLRTVWCSRGTVY